MIKLIQKEEDALDLCRHLLPEGYAIVPITPNDQMISAGIKSLTQRQLATKPSTRIEGVYNAMLEAANP